MLKIKHLDTELIVANIENLNGTHLSGLELAGFQRRGELQYVLKYKDLTTDLMDLIDYLEYEKLEFELDSYLKDTKGLIDNTISDFEYLKEEALNFKNGQFNSEDYDEFQNEINNLIHRPLKNHQKKLRFIYTK